MFGSGSVRGKALVLNGFVAFASFELQMQASPLLGYRATAIKFTARMTIRSTSCEMVMERPRSSSLVPMRSRETGDMGLVKLHGLPMLWPTPSVCPVTLPGTFWRCNAASRTLHSPSPPLTYVSTAITGVAVVVVLHQAGAPQSALPSSPLSPTQHQLAAAAAAHLPVPAPAVLPQQQQQQQQRPAPTGSLSAATPGAAVLAEALETAACRVQAPAAT
jgi:hypothetical protein